MLSLIQQLFRGFNFFADLSLLLGESILYNLFFILSLITDAHYDFYSVIVDPFIFIHRKVGFSCQ